MAIETARLSLTSAGYTAVGTGVTTLALSEFGVGVVRVIVQASGTTAPLVGATNYAEFDGSFSFGPHTEAVDIYMMYPSGQATVGLVRA